MQVCTIYCGTKVSRKPVSIMLQNLPVMLFSILQMFLPIMLIFMLPKYDIAMLTILAADYGEN